GFSGKAAARHEVTKDYRNICKGEGVSGTKEMQACLLKYNNNINKDVETLAEVNTNREKRNEKFADAYDEGKLKNKEILDKVDTSFSGKVGEKNVVIDGSTMTKIKEEYLVSDNNKQDLKDILYYEEMRDKGGIFKDEADKKLAEIWKEINEDYARLNLGQSSIKEWSNSGLEGMSVQTAIFKNQRPIAYKDAVTSSEGWEGIEGS
ncbi:unnamed protein product, partial [marine sediment metagenome]